MSSGNVEKAARLFLQASDTNTTDYLSPGLLGQAYLAMGRREAGEQALQKAMRNLDRHMKMKQNDSRAMVVGAVNMTEAGHRKQAVAWAKTKKAEDHNEPVR